jgi:hypothetical protein
MPLNEGNTLQNYYNQREKVICCVNFFVTVKNMLNVILESHLKVVLVQTPCKRMIEKGEKNFNDDEIIVQISSCKILFNV